MSAVRRCVIASALAFVVLPIAPRAEQLRPLTLDDLFRLEQIGRYFGGPFAFSPDGRQLAYVLQRAKRTTAVHMRSFLWGNDRADIFVAPTSGGAALNISNGADRDAGFWAPAWSPDGTRLAMVSTREGGVHLFMWQAATRTLTPITTPNLDLNSVTERPFVWISNTQIICAVLPEGEKPAAMTREMQAPERAAAAWPLAWKGDRPTANVLDSGVSRDLSARPQGRVVLIDVTTGRTQSVFEGSAQDFTVSPRRDAVALMRQVDIYRPDPLRPLEFGARGRYQVEVVSTSGVRLLEAHDAAFDALPGSLRWSADGNRLAFLSATRRRTATPRLVRVELQSGTVHVVEPKGLDPTPVVRQPPRLLWSQGGEVVLLAVEAAAVKSEGVNARRDWWAIDGRGEPRRLTGGLTQAPSTLIKEKGRDTFVGLADGAIWRIGLDRNEPANVTGRHGLTITSIEWPQESIMGTAEVPEYGTEYESIVVGTRNGPAIDLHVLDLASGGVRALARPLASATLGAYSPVSQTAALASDDRTGLRVWTSAAPFDRPRRMVETNTFLQEITPGAPRLIEYRSLDGESLKAWLTLPVGYEPGKRYPLIVWVYPGSVAGPAPSIGDEVNRMSPLNLQIPAARGYAILRPSMPLEPEGRADDPMLRLPSGVLPAVDKAIELGIADPDRLFLMGQSFGGYATYGLITQTHRFKAAVSLAGLSNLISLYGAFDARLRYDDYPHENLFQAALMESAQVRMGNPPWKDLGRYLRNSPIFAVDRVRTPLLIIQGDLDYVSMSQGEEFFTALYRQGKRAQFIRYWGEGHVLASPANIRDMWDRVFTWLAEFDKGRAGGVTP